MSKDNFEDVKKQVQDELNQQSKMYEEAISEAENKAPKIDERMLEVKKKHQFNKNLKKDNYIFVTPNFGNVPTRMPEKTKEVIKTQSVQHCLY